MIGGTKDEGAMYMPQFLNDPDRLEDVSTDFDLQGPVLWLGVDENDVTEQDSASANIILREYLPGGAMGLKEQEKFGESNCWQSDLNTRIVYPIVPT